MNFFKRLTFWGWAEVIVMAVIVAADNYGGSRDGLWLTLLISLCATVPSIMDEIMYYYSRPVNDPEQRVTSEGVLANLFRSWLGLAMCFAPIFYGPMWVKVLGVLTAIIAAYAILASRKLHYFVKNDVKYEG